MFLFAEISKRVAAPAGLLGLRLVGRGRRHGDAGFDFGIGLGLWSTLGLGLGFGFGFGLRLGFGLHRLGLAVGPGLRRLCLGRFGVRRLRIRGLGVGRLGIGRLGGTALLRLALLIRRRRRTGRFNIAGQQIGRLPARRVVLAQKALQPEQTTSFGQPLRAFVADGAVGGEKLLRRLAPVEVVLGAGRRRHRQHGQSRQAENSQSHQRHRRRSLCPGPKERAQNTQPRPSL
ncbi:hypothetical protein DXH78_14585 [Undibacter mobilis]|uniref:Uncharacterized protein n=1 Tax=Undibacter mobilis TaxID=2292256 RepID=A0A371B2U1_9BRAD|nr:hypothetical protein DXH78_14585 [Undibacter mobilis]